MFNTALTYTTIKNFQKNLKKPIDKKDNRVYNNNEDKERGNDKMEGLKIKKIIDLIIEGKIEINDIFFNVPEIGYVQVDELSFSDGGIEVRNYQVDIKDYFGFNDKLFIENCKKILTNP
jgi:hypothetical protein